MSLSCPACNKPNQEGDLCQRCGCDLSSLHAVRRAALSSLGQARAACRERDWSAAWSKAFESWDLYHSAEAAHWLFVLAGALGDTNAALEWLRRFRALERTVTPSAPGQAGS